MRNPFPILVIGLVASTVIRVSSQDVASVRDALERRYYVLEYAIERTADPQEMRRLMDEQAPIEACLGYINDRQLEFTTYLLERELRVARDRKSLSTPGGSQCSTYWPR